MKGWEKGKTLRGNIMGKTKSKVAIIGGGNVGIRYA